MDSKEKRGSGPVTSTSISAVRPVSLRKTHLGALRIIFTRLSLIGRREILALVCPILGAIIAFARHIVRLFVRFPKIRSATDLRSARPTAKGKTNQIVSRSPFLGIIIPAPVRHQSRKHHQIPFPTLQLFPSLHITPTPINRPITFLRKHRVPFPRNKFEAAV